MKLVLVLVATAAVLVLPAMGIAAPHRPLEVLFMAERDGDYDVYAANADGSAASPVTVNDVADLAVMLSPRGDRLALSRRGRVVIVDLRSGSARVVARGTPRGWS